MTVFYAPAASVQAMGWGVAKASQTTDKFPRKTNAADFALQRRATAGFTTCYLTDTLLLVGRWPGGHTHKGREMN